MHIIFLMLSLGGCDNKSDDPEPTVVESPTPTPAETGETGTSEE